ncbi:MAG: L,D-transpeptidase family protein [Clostridiales bacterium]|nr:L,D-transpeptidase family protein [Clostridiales bacterium]
MKSVKRIMLILLAVFTAFAAGCTQDPIDKPDDIVAIDDKITPPVTAGPTAVPTDTPEPTEVPTPTPITDPDPDHPYYLYVEKGSYTLTIYGKDEYFNYTVIVKQYRIAHGGNKTPTGIFSLSGDRQRWHTFPLGGSAQYATPYWGNLFIHSPLYGAEDPTRLWPSYYNGDKGIGTDHTGGCLRMVTEAAKFIYTQCPEGTKLEIVNGNPKGTTSPEVPPIEKKGYDPTDVDALGGND